MRRASDATRRPHRFKNRQPDRLRKEQATTHIVPREGFGPGKPESHSQGVLSSRGAFGISVSRLASGNAAPCVPVGSSLSPARAMHTSRPSRRARSSRRVGGPTSPIRTRSRRLSPQIFLFSFPHPRRWVGGAEHPPAGRQPRDFGPLTNTAVGRRGWVGFATHPTTTAYCCSCVCVAPPTTADCCSGVGGGWSA